MNLKKHITFSNVLFGLVFFLILYTPTRVWIIRQISFSPSIERIEESPKIGNYNWKLQGLNTPSVNFEAHKGKVIFLNFWATWCPPCLAELPYIQNLYNAYKDKVAFVFITSDSKQTLEDFLKKKGYHFPVYQSSHGFLQDLPLVSSIPRTFIIDKEGRIRVDESGSVNWNSKAFRMVLDEMLQE